MTHLIEPERFADRMLQHWEQNLGNIGSQALKETWAWIGHHINLHLQDHDSLTPSQWYVLSAPTGTGKTQGVITYCAMLSEQESDHPGVLIITRRIADAVDIADQVNRWGARQTAVAYHEGNKAHTKPKLDLEDLEQWPVVVITHAAFLQAFEVDPAKSKLKHFLAWGGLWSERKMRIVDESLDIVKSMDVCFDSLKETWGAIPAAIMKKFPLEMQLINQTLDELRDFTFQTEKVPRLALTIGQDCFPDFQELARAAFPDKGDDNQRKHYERLKSLAGIIKGPWSYTYSDKNRDSLNAARLLLSGGRGCLVLDATAGVDVVYRVHRESQIKLPPRNARRYDNVTLHWSTGHKTGKKSTVKTAEEDIPRLLDNLETALRGKKALLVSHRESEHVIKGYIGKVPFTLAAEHWWNLDGTNQFRDFDVVVLTSLPHLPETWAINTFMAFQGIQGAEWLLDDVEHPWQEFPDIRRALIEGKMAANIIQAINRIRCRRTIDGDGNCPGADIYIKFNTEKQAETILGHITRAMPGIKLKAWAYDPTKAPRKTTKPDAATTLLAFLENMRPKTRLEKKTVIGKTGIASRTMDRLLERLRNAEDNLAKKAKDLGVTITAIRDRRSFKVHFAKF